MAIVKCKPTSAGRRHVVKVVNPELHKGKPFAALLDTKSKTGGRNNYGRITTRHIGGGHKQHYRLIDFKRNKLDIPAVVERLEYDPNRSANIALVLYKDGERRYILAPRRLVLPFTTTVRTESTFTSKSCSIASAISTLFASKATLKTIVFDFSALFVAFSETCGALSTFSKRS